MTDSYNPLSYAFWADAPAGSPGSYEGLQSRRAIIAAQMAALAKKDAPLTVGGGIEKLGQAAGIMLNQRALDKRDTEYQQLADERAKQAAGAFPPSAQPPAATPPPMAYAPAVSPPVPAGAPAAPSLWRQSAMTPYSVEDPPQAPASAADGMPQATPGQMTSARDMLTKALLARQVAAGYTAPAQGGGATPPFLPAASTDAAPPSSSPAPAPDAGTPPVVMDMQPAPASAAPPAPAHAPSPYYRPDPYNQHPGVPPPPQLEPPGAQEKAAIAHIMARPTDPYVVAAWKPVVEAWAAQRQNRFEIQNEVYKKMLDETFATRTEERAAYRGRETTELEQAQKRQGLVTPNVQEAVPQSVLNTPNSPQRSGVPTPPTVPPGIVPAEWARMQGTQSAADLQTADKADVAVPEALNVIAQIRAHPGHDSAVGFFGPALQGIRGTDAKGFAELVAQANGGAFLQAYNALKGGGSITEPEGTKATAAIARLSTAQSKQDFDNALADFENTVRRGYEVAQRKVNRPVTAYQRPGDNTTIAPDLGTRKGGFEYIGGNPALPASWRKL